MSLLSFFRKRPIHVGLDIGSANMSIVVAAQQRDNSLRLLASCTEPSAGIRHGQIQDQQMAISCLRHLIKQAEYSSHRSIKNVHLAITAGNIKGIINHASYRLPEEEYLVDSKHIVHAIEKSRSVELHPDQFIINEQSGRIYIDRRETTHYPIGLAGRTLELDTHLITASKSQLKEQINIIQKSGIQIENIHFAPLAAAQYCLNKKQKEEGALLIDLGAGTSNYICYQNNDILASGSLDIGCDQINENIIQDSNIRNEGVEFIKREYGDAYGDVNDTTLVNYQNERGLGNLKMEQGLLNDIICKHYSTIFANISKELNQSRAYRKSMNTYLIGGGSLIQNVEQLAMYILDMPVEKVRVEEMNYHTAIGLVQLAAES